MMNELLTTAIATVLFIILDLGWFSLSLNSIYIPLINQVQGSAIQASLLKQRWWGGLIAWALLALGIVVFVLPLAHKSLIKLVAYGALYGLIVYGVFNWTNFVMFKNYNNWKVIVPDLLWGIFACTLVSFIAGKALSSLKK